jgi:hypothetical protein
MNIWRFALAILNESNPGGVKPGVRNKSLV